MRVPETEVRSGRSGAALRRRHQPAGDDPVSSGLERVGVGHGVDDGRSPLPPAHLHVHGRHQVPRRRAEQLDEGAGAGRRRAAGRPRLLAVPGDEDQRASAPPPAGQDASRLDHHPHAAAVVVGARRSRRGVVVGADHDELPARLAQPAHDVDTVHACGVEVLEADVGEPGRAQLGGHVLRGGAGAGRAPRVRPQGGERGRVAQGGLAVESGREQQGRQQRVHARRRL